MAGRSFEDVIPHRGFNVVVLVGRSYVDIREKRKLLGEVIEMLRDPLAPIIPVVFTLRTREDHININSASKRHKTFGKIHIDFSQIIVKINILVAAVEPKLDELFGRHRRRDLVSLQRAHAVQDFADLRPYKSAAHRGGRAVAAVVVSVAAAGDPEGRVSAHGDAADAADILNAVLLRQMRRQVLAHRAHIPVGVFEPGVEIICAFPVAALREDDYELVGMRRSHESRIGFLVPGLVALVAAVQEIYDGIILVRLPVVTAGQYHAVPEISSHAVAVIDLVGLPDHGLSGERKSKN